MGALVEGKVPTGDQQTYPDRVMGSEKTCRKINRCTEQSLKAELEERPDEVRRGLFSLSSPSHSDSRNYIEKITSPKNNYISAWQILHIRAELVNLLLSPGSPDNHLSNNKRHWVRQLTLYGKMVLCVRLCTCLCVCDAMCIDS